MVFIMFDQGRGIETPISAVLRHPLVSKVQSSAAINPVQEFDPNKNRQASPDRHAEQHEQAKLNSYLSTLEQNTDRNTNRKPARFAQQIMSTPTITIKIHHTAQDCIRQFHAHQFRHLPVIDQDNKLVGIVSDRDFLIAGKNEDTMRARSFNNTAVELIMSKKVLTATEDTEIRILASVMCENRIGAMPIVDKNHQVIGMVTRSDIMRVLINQTPIELWM